MGKAVGVVGRRACYIQEHSSSSFSKLVFRWGHLMWQRATRPINWNLLEYATAGRRHRRHWHSSIFVTSIFRHRHGAWHACGMRALLIQIRGKAGGNPFAHFPDVFSASRSPFLPWCPSWRRWRWDTANTRTPTTTWCTPPTSLRPCTICCSRPAWWWVARRPICRKPDEHTGADLSLFERSVYSFKSLNVADSCCTINCRFAWHASAIFTWKTDEQFSLEKEKKTLYRCRF